MGGRGSGRSPGYDLDVDLCEQCRSIDLASFKQKGFLFTNCIGTLKWRRRDKVIATIDYRVERDGLRLMYRTRPQGGEWRDVNELIPFVETATRFGGRRKWFSCPSCRGRCRVIYGGAHYRCWTCHGLKYESQYELSWPFPRQHEGLVVPRSASE